MSKSIIINHMEQEIRVAVLENSRLTEIYYERKKYKSPVGNIYKAKVLKILPGMQAAFLDIGLERAAFLYVNDIRVESSEDDRSSGSDNSDQDEDLTFDDDQHDDDFANEDSAPESKSAKSKNSKNQNKNDSGNSDKASKDVARLKNKDSSEQNGNNYPAKNKKDITELIEEGQYVLVQVLKASIGTKGARVTCSISIPGRNIVLLPFSKDISISKQINKPKERRRLRDIVRKNRKDDLGFIVRTIALERSVEEIQSDMEYLFEVWSDIQSKFEKQRAPALLYEELSLTRKVMRESLNESVQKIVVDDVEEYKSLKNHLDKYLKHYSHTIELHQSRKSAFDHYNINLEIDRALGRKVMLPSGGYLIIDQAEALTAIDINTGSFTGTDSHAETIFKTNMEATVELVNQVRLRDLGGLIIIDYIDMDDDNHRNQVHSLLKAELKKDKGRNKILSFSELGLVEMSRKRSQESLNQYLCVSCYFCNGSGRLKSPDTILYDIVRELRSYAKTKMEKNFLINTNHDMAFHLTHDASSELKKLEREMSLKVVVNAKPNFLPEQYEIMVF